MPRKDPLTHKQQEEKKEYQKKYDVKRKNKTPYLTDFERHWQAHDWGIKR